MRCVVMKFGGTSVASGSHWQNIAALVKAYQEQGIFCVIVCSAMASVSDEIEAIMEDALAGKEFIQSALNSMKKRHMSLLGDLSITEDVLSADFAEFASLLAGLSLTRDDSPSLRARIMAKGEFFLTRAGHAYLQGVKGLKAGFVDARDWLVSRHSERYDRQHFLSATCDYSYSEAMVQECVDSGYHVVITQGFIARDIHNKTVLLGRGGSDTSAAYLAAKLGAERVEIWTDVPGIFTANPNLIPSARLLLKLGYNEAQELASSGASVLHPRCIEPLRAASIPLQIRWTNHPEQKGCTVVGKVGSSYPCVKGICIKEDIYVLSMESLGMLHQTGFLADLFSVFKTYGISINTVSTSESNVTVTLDSENQVLGKPQLLELVDALSHICKPKLYSGCVSISLVGKHIRSILHRISPVFVAFEDKKVFVVSQAANDLNISFTIEAKEATKLLRHLHELLFSRGDNSEIFGDHWHHLVGAKDSPASSEDAVSSQWWLDCAQTLVNIQQESHKPGHPESHSTYVYHLPTVAQRMQELQSLEDVDKMFYALKANYYPAIINYFVSEQMGFDCVSVGELDYLRSFVKPWDGSRIVFTPNFPSVKEYAYAFDMGVRVTLDSVYPLEVYPEIFRGKEVMLRFDPGLGKGHHDHVKTAGNRSKFGISSKDLDKCMALCAKHDVRIFGLHAHLGSGITSPESWGQSAAYLASLAAEIGGDVRVLDVGGGFAVPAKPSEASLNISSIHKSLADFKQRFSGYELWIEPGRYLVAESGVLLCTVTQLKRKGSKTFVGVSAGMHVLLRPSLYGAYHHVVNLSKLHEPMSITADVVGPICESGDVIGYARILPHTEPGDILLIACAGAYGSVMAMNYNLRANARAGYMALDGTVVMDKTA